MSFYWQTCISKVKAKVTLKFKMVSADDLENHVLQSSFLTCRLLMTSRWPLFIFGILGQRSRLKWPCMSKWFPLILMKFINHSKQGLGKGRICCSKFFLYTLRQRYMTISFLPLHLTLFFTIFIWKKKHSKLVGFKLKLNLEACCFKCSCTFQKHNVYSLYNILLIFNAFKCFCFEILESVY